MKFFISGKYNDVKKYMNCYKGLNLTLGNSMSIQSNKNFQEHNQETARNCNVAIGYKN